MLRALRQADEDQARLVRETHGQHSTPSDVALRVLLGRVGYAPRGSPVLGIGWSSAPRTVESSMWISSPGARKAIRMWVLSQNGLFDDEPQRQSVARVSTSIIPSSRRT